MLSKKQFDILEAYASHGNLTQRGIAELTNQSIGNTNRLIKELTEAGFVDRGITNPASRLWNLIV